MPETNSPQVLKSVIVAFFFAVESCNSGTTQSRTAKDSKRHWLDNESGASLFLNPVLSLREREKKKKKSKTKYHLKESERRHPAGPALLVLGAEHPQLLHLPSTFIGLQKIDNKNSSKIKQR